ncbi:MAG: hypothetical protein RLZZ234_769 [Candidatus Parcubacteria bacterium]
MSTQHSLQAVQKAIATFFVALFFITPVATVSAQTVPPEEGAPTITVPVEEPAPLVVPQPTLTIRKETIPDGSVVPFTFYNNETNLGTISDGGVIGPVTVAPGTLILGESAPEGWNLVNAECRNEADAVVGSLDGNYYVNVELGDDIACVFTNESTVPTYTIAGYKWRDIDADGVLDAGEPKLSGWTINASNGEDIVSAVTDQTGAYTLEVPSGTWTVTEVMQKGWAQTFPNNEEMGCTFTFTEEVILEKGVPTCNFGNHKVSFNSCEEGKNLVQNGSFENTVVGDTGWQVFDSALGGLEWIVNWVIADGAPEVAKLELQNFIAYEGYEAADGEQYAELDADYDGPGGSEYAGEHTSVRIAQDVGTVPGNTYSFSFAFSALPGFNAADNKVRVSIDGVEQATLSANGNALTDTDWEYYSYDFIAASSTTVVALEDMGITNSIGTLVDDVTVCMIREGEQDTYRLEGFVWNDANASDAIDEGEENLAGFTVRVTNGSETLSTTTDASGFYYFEVPAGTWTITEELPAEWGLTFPNTGSHVVTVPTPVEMTLADRLFALVVPTAHAAVLGTFGPFNFGNIAVNTDSSSSNGGGGSSSGTRVNRTPGEVRGATDEKPVGEVKGAVAPVGAPNTGAGGAAQGLSLITSLALAALVARSTRKTAQ